ncbi:MAG: hypothetical protein RIB60_06625 [Phycisphaerales bacterium]
MSACAMPASPARIARVVLEPDAGSWGVMMHEHLARRGALDAGARAFREQLGLPTDRPVIMSGHQAELWHPGILTKFLAANALAERTGAAIAWLVVDQDANDPFGLAAPARADRAPFRTETWRMGPDAMGKPAMSLPAATPTGAPEFETAVDLGDRFERVRAALRARTDAPNAAVQLTEAVFDLLEGVVDRPQVVYASQIAETDLFARTIERMSDDAEPMRTRYNNATSDHPDAGVRPLGQSGAHGAELPVWRLDDSGRRLPVHAGELNDHPTLVPRGMLATGLARAAGCDLFVHGTGGGAYEPINDAWIPRLMDGGVLAPFVTATADAHLLLSGELVSRQDAQRARWEAHHARHHPGMLDDPDAQRTRNALVDRIRSAPVNSEERAELFRDLHAVLDEARSQHAAALDALDRHADELTARTDRSMVSQDRAWSVALHDLATLAALRERVESCFA